MKKLILGIIAVFCLQLGFTAYFADRSGDSGMIGRVGTDEVEPMPNTAISRSAPSREPLIARSETVERDLPVVTNDRVRAVRTLPAVDRQQDQITSSRAVTGTAKIRQPVYSYASTRAPAPRAAKGITAVETDEKVAGMEVKRGKRSLWSKTYSVVKKPVRWMKNLVAKAD